MAQLLAGSTGESSQKDSVSQDPSASAQEGDPIQLNCSYSGTEYSLQWYKQYPGGRLHFLALLSTSTSKRDDSFVMSLDTKSRKSSLYLNSTRLDDSAVYFCAMAHSGVSGQDSVSQDVSASAKVGEPVQFNCSYSGTARSIQWYKQSPGGHIQLIHLLFRTSSERQGDFTVSLDTAKKTSSLYLKNTRLSDSAVYFCGMEHSGVSGQKNPVSQDPSILAKEGEPVLLNCSYGEAANSIHWYKQSSGGQIQFMAILFKTSSESHGYFVASLDTAKKTSSVYLNSTRLSDAAVYFCAMGHSDTQTHPA
uniref:Uncharacterized protein n=1 Tax=Sphaerodactylus townsendi TaxID=933632 RepID=A0ACB8EXS3_9SAUR